MGIKKKSVQALAEATVTNTDTGTVISVNEEAMEPKDYFEVVKSKLTDLEQESLNKQLDVLAKQIVLAKKVGQKSFLHKLSLTYDVMLKEQELLARGLSKYVLKDDIAAFIDKVTPKNSVKVFE